jgi:hypothetical protein
MHGVTEVCPECQFDPHAELDLAERFTTFAKRYPVPLTRLLKTDTAYVLRTQPAPDTWSALEYAGHVLGICTTTCEWIEATVAQDNPVLTIADVDEEVRNGQFNDVVPTELAAQVAAAANRAAELLAGLAPDALDRTASFSGMTVPLRLLVVAMVHECHHHLLDIGRVLRAVRTGEA